MNETLQTSFYEIQKILIGKSQFFEFLEMKFIASEDFYTKYLLFIKRKTDKKVFSCEIRLTKIFDILKEEESYTLIET